MAHAILQALHDAASRLDLEHALAGLLEEFRRGAIADPSRRQEDRAIERHLAPCAGAWDAVFPEFPDCRCPRRSMRWEYRRGRRDAHLKRLIVHHLPHADTGRRLIVNPAAVFGRHARWLARRLPDYRVTGADIDPGWNRLFRPISPFFYPGLRNYDFVRESIFDPDLERKPALVTFFGACGSVTDAGMDYAIVVGAPLLVCRSCCHDNVGGNTNVVRRRGPLNAFFRWKNRAMKKYKRRGSGFYFSDRYGPDRYPRSRSGRRLMDTATVLAIAGSSPDSDICRFIIDLDRALYLREQGYDVLYREELFFAHRRDG